MKNSGTPGAIGLQAAKWLAEKGYVDKRPGRVSKDELARETAISLAARETLKEDMERLGLSVVNGSN